MTTDKALLKNRFAAKLGTYNTLAVVQDEICGQLDGLLAEAGPASVERALEIGAGTGFLTRRLLERYPATRWTVNDLVKEARPFIEAYAGDRKIEYRWGDAESIELPGGQDLLASASTVQWFDDLQAFLQRAHHILQPQGVLALSTFGPDNFLEIKATTGEGLSYRTAPETRKLLEECGFQVTAWKEYTRSLTFESPREVLRHIRGTGVNSIRRSRWTKQTLEDFERSYRENYTTPESSVTLTYHPILAVCLKK